MYLRLSRFAGLDAERVSETEQQFRDDGFVQLQKQPGFRGITVGVNQSTGQAVAVTLWDSEADMKASEKLANEVRDQAAATATPARDPIVDHYEVVVHE